MISVKILADSISPLGKRLVTREWKYPRNIHAEVLTHKMLSRNSASSRAIPTDKLVQSVIDDPFVPKYIGANQRGMQAGDELDENQKKMARALWLTGRDSAVETARQLLALGIHKQVVNRIIEPWMWITVIVSATENENLWGLRCHKDAEPHFQELAYMDRDAVMASTPRQLKDGQWHTPLAPIDDDDVHAISRYVALATTSADERVGLGLRALLVDDTSEIIDQIPGLADKLQTSMEQTMLKISVGRCARVSYLTHGGLRAIDEDIALHDRLVVQSPLHASPAEHVAQAMDYPQWFKATYEDGLPLLDVLQDRVLTTRRNGAFTGTLGQLQEEAVLAQMRSGNFLGWRMYRKMLPNENIGGLMP